MCVYIVPDNSTYPKHNEYDLLLDDVSRIPGGCGILLCGDYNARTNTIVDYDCYVSGSDGGLENLIPTHFSESYQIISALNEMGRLARCSMDRAPINKRGLKHIAFGQYSDMLICNWLTKS